jgi:cbb3-type cytochrome oxidase subunit 3
MMPILFSIMLIAAGYWSFKHMSLLQMEQASMLPFADDPEAAKRVEQETGRACLPTHLALQVALQA